VLGAESNSVAESHVAEGQKHKKQLDSGMRSGSHYLKLNQRDCLVVPRGLGETASDDLGNFV